MDGNISLRCKRFLCSHAGIFVANYKAVYVTEEEHWATGFHPNFVENFWKIQMRTKQTTRKKWWMMLKMSKMIKQWEEKRQEKHAFLDQFLIFFRHFPNSKIPIFDTSSIQHIAYPHIHNFWFLFKTFQLSLYSCQAQPISNLIWFETPCQSHKIFQKIKFTKKITIEMG